MSEQAGPGGRRTTTTAAGRRLLAVTATSLLLATGCGTVDRPVHDPVRDRWEARTELPNCGAVELRQGEHLRRQAPQQLACLRRALRRGKGAELRVTRPTVEGDPVREHYRLSPSGTLAVYTDSTEDRFSDGKWSHTPCHTPEWLPQVSCAH